MPMTDAERDAAMTQIAATLPGIDVAAYAAAGVPPTTPTLGLGPPDARLAVLGRDPGRDEIRLRTGFIGAGGKKVRTALHHALYGRPAASLDDHLRAGEHVVWVNTVPYKPVGNKAWPEAVRVAFRPYVADLIVHAWRGEDLLALGKEALLWCAGDDVATRQRLIAHLAAEGAFDGPLEVRITAPDGASKALRVHPLPHPSPLNVRWSKAFPGLLEATLRRVGWTAASWSVEGRPPAGPHGADV